MHLFQLAVILHPISHGKSNEQEYYLFDKQPFIHLVLIFLIYASQVSSVLYSVLQWQYLVDQLDINQIITHE